MDCLSNQSGVDYKDRIEVVYHFFSYKHRHGAVLKVKLPRENPVVHTLEKSVGLRQLDGARDFRSARASPSRAIATCAASCCPRIGKAFRCARILSSRSNITASQPSAKARLSGSTRRPNEHPAHRRNDPQHGPAASFDPRGSALRGARRRRGDARGGARRRLSASLDREDRRESRLPWLHALHRSRRLRLRDVHQSGLGYGVRAAGQYRGSQARSSIAE